MGTRCLSRMILPNHHETTNSRPTREFGAIRHGSNAPPSRTSDIANGPLESARSPIRLLDISTGLNQWSSSGTLSGAWGIMGWKTMTVGADNG
jgi:hypothetical protein